MNERKSKLNKGMFSSTTDQWATPQAFFDTLNEEFHFTLDPCATAANAKCSKYYTEADDGLQQNWQGEVVFCNPPYGRAIARWVRKCYDESQKEWHLSPAYDLTYSSSFNGEHATTINGEGKNPSLEDILAVAKNVGIKEKQARDIALDIKNKCLSLVD